MDILIPISIYFDQQNILANLRDLLYHKIEKISNLLQGGFEDF